MRRCLIILGAAISLLASVTLSGAVYANWLARTVIRDLKVLDTTPDATAASRSFIQKYSQWLTEKGCAGNSCQYQFLFTNRIVSRFHLALQGDLRVYVTLHHDSLSFAALEYTSAVFRENRPIVWVQEDFCGKVTTSRCDHFYLDPHGRDVKESWHGNVEFGQFARSQQKQAAWTLNLQCVTSFHGCTDISQLLPGLWKLRSS
jgi:hypothetical protein